MNNYQLSQTVTYYKEDLIWYAYNWFNGVACSFDDKDHFMYTAFENNLKQIEFNDLSNEDFQYLIDNKFLVLSNNEIMEAINEDYLEEISMEHLKLILLPVGQSCNFSCVYCYEDHSNSVKMGKTQKDILINFVKNQNLKTVTIEYFGGEPLLNKQFIFELNSELIKLSLENSFKLYSSITTNAYTLDIDTFSKLLKNNVFSYQITIDGLPEDHNNFRPLKNSDTTFNKIFNNLIKISSLPNEMIFEIVIRVNYNEYSATDDKREKFLELLSNTFGNDKRFSFRFRPIGDYSKMNNRKNGKIYNCSKVKSAEIKNKYNIEATDKKLRLSDLMMYVGKGSYSCYAGKPNSLIIMPDLKVMKCSVAFENPLNCVGKIDDNGIFTKNTNWHLWVKDACRTEEKCTNCHFISQCNGSACPLKNIKSSKIICPDIKDEYKNLSNLILSQLEILE